MGSKNILDEIYDYVGRFVSFPDDESRIAHTLWVAHTHLIESVYYTPRLYVLSAEKRCGKTRLLELTALLVKRPRVIYDPTPSSLYTVIELEKPTLLIDEVDRIYAARKETNTLTGIIDAGFQIGGTVPRVIFDPKRRLEDFHIFGPMLLAGIDKNTNPDTIEDRAITIRLKRKTSEDSARLEKYRPKKYAQQGVEIRKRLEEWAVSVKELADKNNDPIFPKGIDDRDADKWEALLIVADVADEAAAAGNSRWGTLARQAAQKFVKEQAASEPTSPSELLLRHIHSVFEKSKEEKISTSRLLADLYEIEEAPWSVYEYGRELSSAGLARLLRPHGIRSIQYRFDGAKNTHGYAKSSFSDAWQRYTPSEIAAAGAADDTDTTSRGMSTTQHVPTTPYRRDALSLPGFVDP
jgi:hypothetical protein